VIGVGVVLFLRPPQKGRSMTTRVRTLHLPALLLVAAAVLVACAAAVFAVSGKAEATFPGVNGKIAYSAYDENDQEIYTINPGGGGKTQVTNTAGQAYSPSYSPDSRKIAYVGTGGIYTTSATGGGGTFKVTNGDTSVGEPDYSPDGKKIAYKASDGSEGEIYTINVGGGGKVQVTNNSAYEDFFSWGSRP